MPHGGECTYMIFIVFTIAKNCVCLHFWKLKSGGFTV